MRFYYLALALSVFAGALCIAVLRPDLRRILAIAGLVGAFWGPVTEFWFTQDYWRPQGIFGYHWLEDILFGSGLAAAAAGASPFVTRQLLRARSTRPRLLLLILFPIVYVAATVLLQTYVHVNSILSSMACYAGAAVYMAARRPELARVSLATGALLGGIALVGYAFGLDVILDGSQVLKQLWLVGDTRLGVTVLGNVPLTEVIWFACWGAFFSSAVQFAAGLTMGEAVPPSRRFRHRDLSRRRDATPKPLGARGIGRR